MIDDLHSSPTTGLVRPAALIAGCILVVALVLCPFALSRTGSGGLMGLAIAAAICLSAAWFAELLNFGLRRHLQPLAILLIGMAIRMAPPLLLCLVLAAQGIRGQDHLAFFCYLLTFYVATLAVETWLTVKRVASNSSSLDHRVR